MVSFGTFLPITCWHLCLIFLGTWPGHVDWWIESIIGLGFKYQNWGTSLNVILYKTKISILCIKNLAPILSSNRIQNLNQLGTTCSRLTSFIAKNETIGRFRKWINNKADQMDSIVWAWFSSASFFFNFDQFLSPAYPLQHNQQLISCSGSGKSLAKLLKH